MIASVLAVKMLILVFGLVSWSVLENTPSPGLLNIWNRWDATHYQSLAIHGYQAGGNDRFLIVFFPLYPWLVRPFAFAVGNPVIAALVVSGIASVVAAILLQQLAEFDWKPSDAQSAVWFLLIFPTSYFLHIGYTESLFLALVLGSFVAARRKRWALAGMIGFLAALTRLNGLILIPALAAEAWDDYRQRRKWDLAWFWILFIGLGFLIYIFLNYHVTGSSWTFVTYQKEHWFRSFAWPWVGIRESLGTFLTRKPEDAQIIGGQELLFALYGLVCCMWCLFKLRLSYGLWMVGNWLLIVSTPFFLSVPRYSLMMFPIYILFAHAARQFFWRLLLTCWSLLFLALFAANFARGHWSF